MRAIVFRLTDFSEAAEAKPFQPRKIKVDEMAFFAEQLEGNEGNRFSIE
ncbi:MAG: hypothetical protein WAT57_05660 [Enterococcus aquimarinus]